MWCKSMVKKTKKPTRQPFRQMFVQLLEREMTASQLADFDGEKIAGYVEGNSVTPADIMAVVMMHKAMKGDAKAFEFIRDIIGEKPKDKQEPHTDEIPKILIKRV